MRRRNKNYILDCTYIFTKFRRIQIQNIDNEEGKRQSKKHDANVSKKTGKEEMGYLKVSLEGAGVWRPTGWGGDSRRRLYVSSGSSGSSGRMSRRRGSSRGWSVRALVLGEDDELVLRAPQPAPGLPPEGPTFANASDARSTP